MSFKNTFQNHYARRCLISRRLEGVILGICNESLLGDIMYICA